MKIVTYHDLKSKSGLLPLLEQAFGWPFNEREFNRFIKIDPRMRGGAVGFCALEKEQVVSYVGTMDLATRTMDGTIEHAGGIYGVATLPGYTRRGFSTALFRVVHEHFKEKGYRFSFLNTSPILVAYSLYKKLGYSDVYLYPSAYKVMDDKKKALPKTRDEKLDLGRILAAYRKYVKDKVGFVVRDRAYLEMLAKDKRLTNKGTAYADKGYVVFRKEQYSTRILELVALNKKEAEQLMEAVEQKAHGAVFAKGVLDATLRQTYLSRGYTFLDKGHGVFMAKSLEMGTSPKEVYGEDFFQTQLDHF